MGDFSTPVAAFWLMHERLPSAVVYNHAYGQHIGLSKHPKALGEKMQYVFPEVWEHGLGRACNMAMKQDSTFHADRNMFYLLREDYLEETYFTWSVVPIKDRAGDVIGIFSLSCQSSSS